MHNGNIHEDSVVGVAHTNLLYLLSLNPLPIVRRFDRFFLFFIFFSFFVQKTPKSNAFINISKCRPEARTRFDIPGHVESYVFHDTTASPRWRFVANIKAYKSFPSAKRVSTVLYRHMPIDCCFCFENWEGFMVSNQRICSPRQSRIGAFYWLKMLHTSILMTK